MARPTRFHHVAFGTKDLEATYDFYANRLGLELSHCENHRSGTGWFKHFFFHIGNGEQLGFFAFHDVGERPACRTDISTGLGLPVWINHVAFNLGSMAEIEAMKARAQSSGVKLAMEIDHGACYSIYFVDPNGIMVEFATDTAGEMFTQAPAEALRLLRQDPSEIGEEHRKDATTAGIKTMTV
ncbi:MAG TPA: VOC family protein [Candidatus Eisenbacteria bacterium]|nr:VOC family protein [Candidatus Eisenbacteria bacterium]